MNWPSFCWFWLCGFYDLLVEEGVLEVMMYRIESKQRCLWIIYQQKKEQKRRNKLFWIGIRVKEKDGYNGGDFVASCWDCAAIPMVLILFQLVPPGCLLCLPHISLSGNSFSVRFLRIYFLFFLFMCQFFQ